MGEGIRLVHPAKLLYCRSSKRKVLERNPFCWSKICEKRGERPAQRGSRAYSGLNEKEDNVVVVVLVVVIEIWSVLCSERLCYHSFPLARGDKEEGKRATGGFQKIYPLPFSV